MAWHIATIHPTKSSTSWEGEKHSDIQKSARGEEKTSASQNNGFNRYSDSFQRLFLVTYSISSTHRFSTASFLVVHQKITVMPIYPIFSSICGKEPVTLDDPFLLTK